MIGETRYHQLRETAWRRKLTELEACEMRAHLAAHPEAQADWEAEAALNDALGQLKETAVSSNFTALVLQAVERENAKRARSRAARWNFGWPLLNWAPKVAAAMLVLAVSLVVYQRHQVASRRELAASVAAVANVKSLPPYPEVLEDFEAIRRLSQTPPADEALLALLK
jgi:hypothetical protein